MHCTFLSDADRHFDTAALHDDDKLTQSTSHEQSSRHQQHKASQRTCSNSERLRHLSSACQSFTHAERRWSGHGRFLVDDKHKLVYCSVSKAGCTQFKGLMESANTNDTKYLTNQKYVHSGSSMQEAHIRLLFQFSAQLQNYTKVLLVRHPFDRAVSAYKNLRIGMKNYGPGPGVYRHLQKLYPESSSTGGNKCDRLNFTDYIRFITTPHLSPYKVFNDRHFKSTAMSCGLCHIEYDYFLRLESFATDIKPILKQLELPADYLDNIPALNKAKVDRKRSSPSSANDDESAAVTSYSKYLKEYAVIPRNAMDTVAARYRLDLVALGYHMNYTSQMASCDIRTDEGESCC